MCGCVCVVPTLAENGLQVSVDVRRCREPFLTELLLSDNLPHTSSNISCSEWRGIACGVCVECGVCRCVCVEGDSRGVYVWYVCVCVDGDSRGVCVCGVWCVCGGG